MSSRTSEASVGMAPDAVGLAAEPGSPVAELLCFATESECSVAARSWRAAERS
jgi:hypothetical protein